VHGVRCGQFGQWAPGLDSEPSVGLSPHCSVFWKLKHLSPPLPVLLAEEKLPHLLRLGLNRGQTLTVK